MEFEQQKLLAAGSSPGDFSDLTSPETSEISSPATSMNMHECVVISIKSCSIKIKNMHINLKQLLMLSRSCSTFTLWWITLSVHCRPQTGFGWAQWTWLWQCRRGRGQVPELTVASPVPACPAGRWRWCHMHGAASDWTGPPGASSWQPGSWKTVVESDNRLLRSSNYLILLHF